MAQPPSPTPPARQQPIRGNAEISAQIGELDGDLAKLKVKFDQHFLGIERKPPTDDLNRLRNAVMNLRRAFTNNTALKFRIDTLFQKFKTYEQLWLKTMKEIEEGTYRKDLMRLRLQNLKKAKNTETPLKRSVPNFDEDELDQALDDALGGFMDDAPSLESLAQVAAEAIPQPARAPQPPATQHAAFQQPPHPASAFHAQPSDVSSPIRRVMSSPQEIRGGFPQKQVPASPIPQPPRARPSVLTDARVDEIYKAYIQAKRQCNENTSGITREALASSLKSRVTGDSDVKVIIRGGKAMLSLVKKG